MAEPSTPRLRIRARNAVLDVVDGRIDHPAQPCDIELHVPDGLLQPGLINSHDHLHRNHYGRLGAPPYANAYEWGRDIHARFADTIAACRAVPRRDALLLGAWKNLVAGVTTVVHHDAWELDFDEDFPLRVARVRSAHSLELEPRLDGLDDGRSRYCIHVAEGVDRAAADEVRTLAARGLLTSRLLAVHVVGADEDGVRRLRAADAALVWCPSSNQFLFGSTAPASLLAPGMDVLLGSDSLLTGDGTLLDELRAALQTGLLPPERLRAAVTGVAARRLGLTAPALSPGARADLVVLRRDLLEAGIADIAVVVAGGVLRVLDPMLLSQIGTAAERGCVVDVAGVRRWLSGPLPTRALRSLRIQSLPAAPPGTSRPAH